MWEFLVLLDEHGDLLFCFRIYLLTIRVLVYFFYFKFIYHWLLLWSITVWKEKSHTGISLRGRKECGLASVPRAQQLNEDREHKLYWYFRNTNTSFFIHICASWHTVGQTQLGWCSPLFSRILESSQLITSIRLACRSTSNFIVVVVIFGLRFTFSIHDDGGVGGGVWKLASSMISSEPIWDGVVHLEH